MEALARLRWLTPSGVAELAAVGFHRLTQASRAAHQHRRERRCASARLVHEYQRELAVGPRPPRRPLM